MESLLKEWDGETTIISYDKPTGAWIFIAIFSTRLGPAGGGTRMKPYSDVQSALQDALRLAEGMTYKFALSGMSFGGGKTVIAIPRDFDLESRHAILRRYGEMVHKLGGLFFTGPDVGMSSTDMDIISETGSPYIFGRTPEAGGAGTSGPRPARLARPGARPYRVRRPQPARTPPFRTGARTPARHLPPPESRGCLAARCDRPTSGFPRRLARKTSIRVRFALVRGPE